ncbi:HesA/MoeB/ThiF family protein [Blastococcus sp. SYSU D00669]
MFLTGSAVVLICEDVARTIGSSSATWGQVQYKLDEVNDVIAAVGVSERDGPRVDISRDTLRGSALQHVDRTSGAWWYRAIPGLHEQHRLMLRLGAHVPLDAFAAKFPAWRVTGHDAAAVLLTHEPDSPHPWAAWAVVDDVVLPQMVTVFLGPKADPTAALSADWPVGVLAETRVTVVGVGSIGSAAAHALAMAGVGHLSLVDPDRLLWHNLVRHTATRRDVGRYKVDAVAEAIMTRWPGTRVDPLRLSVIAAADQMRPLFDASDVVVGAPDGVAPRRVVSHLARRSRIPSVLACVLLDGSVGEVLRLRPWPGHGCLLCQRQQLIDDGVLDPEPAIDRPYGTGDRHLPMTAVGSDLQMVGQLAAKVAVATVLEAHGHHDQSIRGEYAMLGLRPGGDTAEYGPPFDVPPGGVQWLPAAPQRPDCPTCGQ